MTPSVLKVPGIARVSAGFLRGLWAMAARHGWNVDGPAAVMSHESGFRPDAQSSKSSAVGLIQFIRQTALTLGTTRDALLAMTAEEQLPYVEAFFVRTLGGRKPVHPEDWILAPYGRADLSNAPDGTVIDRRDGETKEERDRYAANSALDAEGKGYITVGDLRASMRNVVGAAKGARVPIPGPETIAEAGAAAVVLALGAVIVWKLQKGRRK